MLDAVVIGAGISGLRVADLVHAAGRTVHVVESRDRVGGRLHSPNGLDLGATWFWSHEQQVTSLIDELGLETHAQFLDGDALYHRSPDAQRLDGNPIDVPAGRITDGVQELARAVAARLPDSILSLNRPATSVSAVADGLEVATTDGPLQAHHVVLAVPPALAVHRLAFTPELPDRLAELARNTPVWMGSTVKVVAEYASAFWREQGLAGAAISHVGPIREFHDMSGPDGQPAVLFGFAPLSVVGAAAPAEEAVLAQLAEVFGPEAARPKSLQIVDWRSEADTSPPGVEGMQAYKTYGHPGWDTPSLGGCLHWSSTETSPVNPGHIDGALARAATVAERIHTSLNQEQFA